jgi:nucleotide-binding universal stress UspA family protein
MAAVKTIRKILAAVDFSEYSDPVLDAAVGFARQFDAELHLVHAYDVRIPLVTPLAPYGVSVPPVVIEQTQEAAAAKLDALARRAAAEGVAATSHVSGAPAASAIVDLAGELEADLIIMGTRGHTGLKHVLLGSVAERTLRHAPCWVLAVKESPDSPHLG